MAQPRKTYTRTTTERGYGTPHQAIRKQWAPVVARGEAQCAEVICLMRSRWIPPGTSWDLAHGTTRDTYRGPAHQRCNRAEGARRGNRQRARQQRATALRW